MMAATGASGNQVRPLRLKSMRLNGNTGEVTQVNTDKELGPNESYETTPLPAEFGVVFIKSRRKLVESDQNGIVMSTTEHDTKDDYVLLFKDGKKLDEGIGSDLREKYPKLRTWQVVYVRYKGEINRLTVKGLSLSNGENKAGYYDYLNSFDSEKNEAMFDFMTNVSVVKPQIEGEVKNFFAFHYERGEELTDEQKSAVVSDFTMVHENAEATRVRAKVQQPQASEVTPSATSEYPEQEINPEDIPFN